VEYTNEGDFIVDKDVAKTIECANFAIRMNKSKAGDDKSQR